VRRKVRGKRRENYPKTAPRITEAACTDVLRNQGFFIVAHSAQQPARALSSISASNQRSEIDGPGDGAVVASGGALDAIGLLRSITREITRGGPEC
jgi:hypothetical protein